MRNIKLTIEYDGTNFCGWQVQNHGYKKRSIQAAIEKALSKILQESPRIIGSGRTDAGVHAEAQVANFKTDSQITLDKLKKALNSLLPDNISIKTTQEVSQKFHARFSAKTKIYRYSILNAPGRLSIGRDYFYHVPYRLDIGLMRKEAKCLLGRHDFSSFCKSNSSVKDTVRTIKAITINCRHRKIYLEIEADGFLNKMVRSIVGSLIDISRGRFPAGSMKRILEAKDRFLCGTTAPAGGLCLLKVRY